MITCVWFLSLHIMLCVCMFILKVKVLVGQSCLTLCKPMDCSPPGSSFHGILQARTLGWVDIPFSRGSSWSRNWTQVSCIADRFFTIWTTREAFLKILFLFYFTPKTFCIGVKPINNVVIVSGGQQRDSATHTHVSILPQTPLPSRLSRNIE